MTGAEAIAYIIAVEEEQAEENALADGEFTTSQFATEAGITTDAAYKLLRRRRDVTSRIIRISGHPETAWKLKAKGA